MQVLDQIKIEEGFEAECRDLVEKYPQSVIFWLPSYFCSKGFPEKGLSLLISALDKKPEYWELYDQLVFISIKAEKPTLAEEKLTESQGLYPDNPWIYGSLGKFYALKKKFAQAKEFLEKSLKLYPENKSNYPFLILSRLALLSEGGLKDDVQPELSQLEKEIRKLKEFNPEMVPENLLNRESILAQENLKSACSFLESRLRIYLEEKIELNPLRRFFLQFYLEPDQLDWESLKDYIYALENRSKPSDTPDEKFSQLGCSYLLHFVNLIRSAEDQLKKALCLDPEFGAARVALGILQRKQKEIYSLFDTLEF